jgi:hypothetical protein
VADLDRKPSYVDVLERVLHTSHLSDQESQPHGRLTDLTVTPGIAGSRTAAVHVTVLDGACDSTHK